MPSSDPMTIAPVLTLLKALYPVSILDVGCGNGKYGFLFREMFDWNHGRFKRKDWQVTIDGLDIYAPYLTDIHMQIYNVVYAENWLDFNIPQEYKYDVIFMGDVLEHFEEELWQKALGKAKDSSNFVVTVCPNWDGSIDQPEKFGNIHEEHKVVLTPERLGGRCVWANTKAFVSLHSKHHMALQRDLII